MVTTYPTKNAYLQPEDVDKIWVAVNADNSELSKDTEEFIKKKEYLNARYILGEINMEMLLEGIRAQELKFRQKHGTEFHHGNLYFEKFYDFVNKKYLHLVQYYSR